MKVWSLESCGRLNRQLRRTLGWWERTSTLFWLLLLFAGIVFCECVANDIHNESVHVFWCYGLQIISLLLLNWTRSGREGRPSFVLSFTTIYDQSYTLRIWSWTPDVHCLQQICSHGFHIYQLESILIPAYESSVTVILSNLRITKQIPRKTFCILHIFALFFQMFDPYLPFLNWKKDFWLVDDILSCVYGRVPLFFM